MSYKYETHMHTSDVSACSSATPKQQVHAYKERGYTGIIITNHFINSYIIHSKEAPWAEMMMLNSEGYRQAKLEGDKIGLDVFFGFEYTISGKDFLTYGISTDLLIENPDMDKLTIEEYSKFVRQNGGWLAQAHPYREAYYIPDPTPVKPEFIDGIEVYNVTMPEEINAKALAFATKNNLTQIGGTDCHHLGGTTYSGIELKKRAKTIEDIIASLRANKFKIIAG